MALITSVKSTSAVGSFFRRQALDMARYVAKKGGGLKRIYDLFILKASGIPRLSTGRTTIIEVAPMIIGGFGGRNGQAKLYVPTLVVSFGALIDDISRKTMRLDPVTGAFLPHKDDDRATYSYPLGDGRVAIGDVPDWSAGRVAVDPIHGAVGTGVYTVCPSAVTIGTVCAVPDSRGTLLLCRTSPQMGVGLKVETTTGLPILPEDPEAPQPEVPPDWYPAISGGTPRGSPYRISGVEFGADMLLGADTNHRFIVAGPCVEWGPLRGAAMYSVSLRDEDDNHTGDAISFLRYLVADGGETAEGARFTGTGEVVYTLDVSALPSGDEADDLSEVAAADFDPDLNPNIPAWAEHNTLVGGRTASPGVMRLPRDLNSTARLWGDNMAVGADATAHQPLLSIVEVAASVDSAITLSVTASYLDQQAAGGFSYITRTVRAASGVRYLTYAVVLPASGPAVLRKIGDFVDERYNTAGALTREQWSALGAVSASDGTARLVCLRRDIPYEVRPADPDTPAQSDPASPSQQGEPARRVPTTYSSYVKPEQVKLFLVSASGEMEVTLTGNYPAGGYLSTGTEVVEGGRIHFADTGLYDPESIPRYGYEFPQLFCQYAPGYMLVLGHPNGGFANTTWGLTLFIVYIDTGEVVQQINTNIQTRPNARHTLSCIEQAVLDEGGQIVAHGKVMLSVSTTLVSEGRTDGIYLIHGMQTISWLAREPSNIAAVYAGNALVPATLGVTTNLMCLPKPKPPEP